MQSLKVIGLFYPIPIACHQSINQVIEINYCNCQCMVFFHNYYSLIVQAHDNEERMG